VRISGFWGREPTWKPRSRVRIRDRAPGVLEMMACGSRGRPDAREREIWLESDTSTRDCFTECAAQTASIAWTGWRRSNQSA
jgi:hypothetical protein